MNRLTKHSQRQLFTRPIARLALLILSLASFGAAANCRISDIYQTASPERFQNSGGGTITDNVTGLMWQKCLLGRSGNLCEQDKAGWYSWPEALDAAMNNRAAGYSNWRLPNIKELASLIEYSCIDPAIDENLFPRPGEIPVTGGKASYLVWSSTPYYDSGLIRYLDFSNGSDNSILRSNKALVRLVRDLHNNNQ